MNRTRARTDSPATAGDAARHDAAERGVETSAARGVARELRDAGHPLDAAALAVVPACLLAAFALPAPLRRDLAFAYADPTLATAYASHFVHLHAVHLAANLAVYALVVPVAYLLCALSGRRGEFYVAGTAFLAALPFALSALNVALVRPRVGYGFSGINTAFFGFLPVALFGYLPERLDVPVTPRDAPAAFFAGCALVALVAVPASAASLAAAAVAAAAATAYLHVPSLASLRRLATLPARHPGHAELAAAATLAFAAFPLVAFPDDPASAGVVVNLYVHLLGYALGFIASHVTFSLVGVAGDPGPTRPSAAPGVG